jgi:hypothetical protein
MASTNPIIRSTPEKRLANFQANSTSIYNKFSPFTNNGIGPSQPFVYTKISDSNISRNLTKYDTQAFPIGSTARDLKRIGQYMITGKGLLYTGKQLLLQNTNAFNETRIYNPLSLLKATAKPGSLGLINYPQRHLETSGGILNFFKDALLSTLGMQSKNLEEISSRPINGTATGTFSAYAGARGGARAGVLRYNTAIKASTRFDTVWVSSTSNKGTGGGFSLANLGKALKKKLISFIPSTNPMGAFGGSVEETWKYRPEYSANKEGIYFKFKNDASGFLSTTTKTGKYQQYYNGPITLTPDAISKVSAFHKYSPDYDTTSGGNYPTKKGALYAGPDDIAQETVGFFGNNILTKLNNIVRESATDTKPQLKRSAEMYTAVKDFKGVSYRVYEDIPQKDFERRMSDLGSITLNEKGFAKVSSYSDVSSGKVSRDASDTYNKLGVLNGDRKNIHREITGYDENQSQDLIFFYFFDLINNVYIPFRATISSLTDQHSADWEDINYLGRADKLFLYKGFSRDTSFSFTVYANSAKEMLPMWNRINYLVGLTKPSKYTEKAVVTNENFTRLREVGRATVELINNAETEEQREAMAEILANLNEGENKFITTGKESKFIYPPMVTLRLGDLFYDQPCVISSVGINIPDDTNWESLRSEDYYYDSSPTNRIKIDGTKSRQLPMKVDVQVQLKMLEKRQALGSDGHYGDSNGKDWKL